MSHASLRMIVHVANGIWRPMDSHANDDQRERFIKPTVAGEIKVAFTLTKPGAGSGADIRCSVVREDDTYYLSGEKHLITFGTIADYLMTFARVEGTRGTEGTVALMVPTRGEGVDAREMPETMGVRGTDHGHIVFDRARAGGRPVRRGGPGRGDRARAASSARAASRSPRLGGPGPARAGSRARLRPAARDVRQEDRRAPGHRLPAGRDGHGPRGRPSPRAARGHHLGGDRQRAHGGGDGQAVRRRRYFSA